MPHTAGQVSANPSTSYMHQFFDLETLIQQYGYLAIFLGVIIEGEMVILVAGFLAWHGYMNPLVVAITGFIGSICNDQILFFLGRYKGSWLLAKFPRIGKGIEELGKKVKNHEVLLIMGFRFMYGFKTITPIFLGINRTAPLLFATLNALSAGIWSATLTAAGFYAGEVLLERLRHLHKAEPFIIAGFCLIVLTAWLALYLRRKRQISVSD